MIVFITSSPYIDGADRAILNPQNEFLDRLRAVLPPNPRALFICANPEDREGVCRFAAETTGAFCEAGIAFCSYHVLDGESAEDAAWLVADSDIVILSGGHVPTQNEFFRDIQLAEYFEDYGGVVLGISAGSMNLADVVYAQPEEEGESDPEFERFLPGLGLTDINILPHYQKVRDNILDGLRLYEDITYADSMENCFFALPDGSYIYQDEDGQLLCGEAYRIQNGILERLTKDGDVLDLEELDI